jgi:hypothetical protein
MFGRFLIPFFLSTLADYLYDQTKARTLDKWVNSVMHTRRPTLHIDGSKYGKMILGSMSFIGRKSRSFVCIDMTRHGSR